MFLKILEWFTFTAALIFVSEMTVFCLRFALFCVLNGLLLFPLL